MAEYIERENAIQQMADNFRQASVDGCDNRFYQVAEDTLTELPAADVEPVKRGCWSLRCDSRQDLSTGEYDEDFYLECSECKRKVWDIDQSIAMSGEWGKLVEQYPYCHCGRKMDGGKPNEEL